ncbi:MAG TPA: hypothetical protein VMV75_04625 [Sulfuricella sp.]|nr:hypothetical protein [Sulfuricella sp.]
MNWIHENLLAIFSLLLNLAALALIGLILINQNNTMSSIHDASAQMKAMGAGAINKPEDLGPRINLLDTSLNKIDSKLGQLGTKLNEIGVKSTLPDSTKPSSTDAKLIKRINSKLDKIDSRLTDIQAESRKLDSKATRVEDAIKELKKQARNNRGYVFP